jgi:osmotically-inducible protein OsmY
VLLAVVLVGCTSTARRPPDAASDAALQRVAEVALAVEGVAAGRIEVSVVDGIVELAGVADTADQVRRILRRVAAIEDVRGVVNRLRILPRAP